MKKDKNGLAVKRLKSSVVCTNCGGSCDNSQLPSQVSSEDEETNTILEQIIDEIDNEEDHDETDDTIADDEEKTSAFDIPISSEDDENTTPGSSTRIKRIKEIELNFEIASQMWIRLTGSNMIRKTTIYLMVMWK
ncbi:hypothetical protein HHI36_022056 [Cryptolaemus montrouzieri]|uniref:Uncharacterized protein n=1 Tax=Cryptolaemus montrouzieri TaxID=559131 RepID=A0ABD2MYR4_9CUCU